MSEKNNIVPENIKAAMYDLIESSSIDIDDETEERLEPDIATDVAVHNLELGSLIHTVSVDAIAELLIEKGIITEEEYKNAMYLKLLGNADLVEDVALRAAALKSVIYSNGDPVDNTNTEGLSTKNHM